MRAALGRNVVANILSALSGIAASLVSLPIVLSYTGAEGYGVWTIGLALIVYLSVADSGFGPAVQRWSALAKGEESHADVRRLLWSALALYLVVGSVAMAAVVALAPSIASLFDFPSQLREPSVEMLRVVGVVVLVLLLAAAVGNVMQGLERFFAVGVTSAQGAVTYLVAVVALLEAGRGVVGLAEATLIQQVVVLLARLWAVRDVIAGGAPKLLRRQEVRELAVFSAKLQVSVFAWLINSQSDKIVMGLVASTATLGQLGIASQVADAGRLVAGAALAPIISSLAVTVGAAQTDLLRRHFAWVHRLWLELIAGGTVVGLGALYPLLYAWLGEGYEEAAVFGAFLVAAMGFALAPGTAAAYLRALGRPSVESRYGVVMVGLNLVFTVALAVAFGPLGVVGGTLAAYALAAIWFLRRFAVEAPETVRPAPRDAVRPALLALAAGAFTAAAGLGLNEVLPRGLALVAIAAAATLALAGYLSAVSGRPLTPRGFRALLAELRQPA